MGGIKWESRLCGMGARPAAVDLASRPLAVRDNLSLHAPDFARYCVLLHFLLSFPRPRKDSVSLRPQMSDPETRQWPGKRTW